jgi:hypothetical protein
MPPETADPIIEIINRDEKHIRLPGSMGEGSKEQKGKDEQCFHGKMSLENVDHR